MLSKTWQRAALHSKPSAGWPGTIEERVGAGQESKLTQFHIVQLWLYLAAAGC
jgi:hypothetical protein